MTLIYSIMYKLKPGHLNMTIHGQFFTWCFLIWHFFCSSVLCCHLKCFNINSMDLHHSNYHRTSPYFYNTSQKYSSSRTVLCWHLTIETPRAPYVPKCREWVTKVANGMRLGSLKSYSEFVKWDSVIRRC